MSKVLSLTSFSWLIYLLMHYKAWIYLLRLILVGNARSVLSLSRICLLILLKVYLLNSLLLLGKEEVLNDTL